MDERGNGGDARRSGEWRGDDAGRAGAFCVRDAVRVVDALAPFDLAEPWDRVGLQVGSPGAPVTGVLVALEADAASLAAARRLGRSLLLAHHPLLFAPLERLTDGSPTGALALRAARDDTAVLVAHTNLDKARGGLGDVFAAMLGLEDVHPLAPAPVDWCKLVGFVPEDAAPDVRAAVFAAGGGRIGAYEHCSFATAGKGTFYGGEGASPVVGEAGRDELVGELRLEIVFPRRLRRDVIDAYVAVHPYEEPAFDVYQVDDEVAGLGLGRVGDLPRPQMLSQFAADLAAELRLPALRVSSGPERELRRVACVPGSGASLIEAAAASADVLVTGDVKYHEARHAHDLGLGLVDVPHDVVEDAALARWAETLADALAREGVRVEVHRADHGVWTMLPGGAPAPRPRPALRLVHSDDTVGDEEADEPAGEPVHPANRDDMHHHLYTDGGARGNPGPAGIGARLLTADGTLVDELSDVIGDATNNVAEYEALLAGLELALDRGVQRLTVFMDSELVVRQLTGRYKVKNADLKALHAEAARRLHGFREVDVKHIRREQNADADRLVNEALDRAGH
jgi:dinuclear metal center YbgI/SA1388 family protein